MFIPRLLIMHGYKMVDIILFNYCITNAIIIRKYIFKPRLL